MIITRSAVNSETKIVSRLKKTIGLGCIALASASFSSAAASSYEIIDLGLLNDNAAAVNDINNLDVSVGYSYRHEKAPSGQNAVVLPVHGFANQNGVMSDFSAIVNENGTDQSAMFAVNNNGMAVGYSLQTALNTPNNFERAIYANLNDLGQINVIPLASSDVYRHMRALGVNDSGIIVGFTDFDPVADAEQDDGLATTLVKRGFIFDSATETLTVLKPLDKNKRVVSAVVRDINDNGRFVGWSGKVSGDKVSNRGFYGEVVTPNRLSEMPLSSNGRSNFPWAINNHNKVVGKRQVDESFYYSAYIYDIATQELTDIEGLKKGYLPETITRPISVAYDINNANQVVGAALVDVVPSRYHAFIYEGGVTRDLNDLVDCQKNVDGHGANGWVFYEARAINDNGIIVGNGLFQKSAKANFEKRAFMLKPRPGLKPAACPAVAEKSGAGSFSALWLLVLFAGFGAKVRLSPRYMFG